ncbi:HlyD family secretion protein [Rhodovulum iodosum]|uniref:Membrane fusion protein (MFP) family protein n=1 Tax=Rhodovulum iodosum TaxID=68291 RepID=A0ABV3XXZ0_9RHOB|nr:HlyD family type I secretion periplasmic adaptor subunit [Rhodovulum robiginosum]RSK38859.1 HlyD family type I secretion periplasmic adaptor subunit [Rhodovulum robiginosum]
MTDHAAPALHTGLRPLSLIGGVAGLVFLVLLVAWAAFTPIAGAVIAPGQAVVRGQPKLVQSLDGGRVEAIAVKSGDRVAAGQVLLRLDPTLLEVNLEIARARLAEALARQARLRAEHLGLAAPRFDYPPLPFTPPGTVEQEEGQRQIFAARAELLAGRAAQLQERRAQLNAQTGGIAGQLDSKRAQLGYIEEDLGNIAALAEKGLARDSQRLELQRSRAELLGQISALEADRARLVNTIRDAEIEALQRQREFKEQVVTELREVTAEIEELIPQIVITETRLDQVVIRAPVAGVVHEMAVSTVGGVVPPGETILQVIPLEQGLDFEVRLDPRAVDRVHPGQPAQLVMAALDPKATPRLKGHVRRVSPGTVTDPATGQAFYRVVLDVTPEELARLGPEVALVPGMPVEAFLETGERTVLRYLLKPLSAQFERAFRED